MQDRAVRLSSSANAIFKQPDSRAPSWVNWQVNSAIASQNYLRRSLDAESTSTKTPAGESVIQETSSFRSETPPMDIPARTSSPARS